MSLVLIIAQYVISELTLIDPILCSHRCSRYSQGCQDKQDIVLALKLLTVLRERLYYKQNSAPSHDMRKGIITYFTHPPPNFKLRADSDIFLVFTDVAQYQNQCQVYNGHSMISIGWMNTSPLSLLCFRVPSSFTLTLQPDPPDFIHQSTAKQNKTKLCDSPYLQPFSCSLCALARCPHSICGLLGPLWSGSNIYLLS